MNRFFSTAGLILAAVFVTACGGSEGDAGAPQQTASAGYVAQEFPDFEYPTDPISFEFYWNYGWKSVNVPFDENNEISGWIIENLGVDVDQRTPGGDPTERLNIMLATDDLPEVIMMDRGDVWRRIVALDKFHELDEYVEAYPGYRSVVEPDVINMSRVDGNIYGMLNWPRTSEHLGFAHSWVINTSLHEQLGSPAIETHDDLYNYLVQVRDSGVQVDGRDVIPLQANASSFGSLWASFGGGRAPREVGAGLGLISARPNDDGDLYLILEDPQYVEFVRFLNRLYTERLINQDLFIETRNQIREKLNQGVVAMVLPTGLLSDAGTANTILEQNGIPVVYDNMLPIVADSSIDRGSIYTSNGNRMGWNVISITDTVEDEERIERIYAYLDWAISPDGWRVQGFGPQGFLWDETDADGYPVLNQGASLVLNEEEREALPIGTTFALLGNTVFYDYAKMRINNQLPPEERDWLISNQTEHVGSYIFDDTAFQNLEPPAGSQEAQLRIEVIQLYEQALTEMIVNGTQAGIPQMVSDLTGELYDRGYQTVLDYANQAWRANMRALGN